MLTPREAFKVGFLQKCAEDGMTIEETHERVKMAIARIEKQAAGGPPGAAAAAPGILDTIRKVPGVDLITRLGEKGIDLATDLVSTPLRYMTNTGLVGAGIAPAAGGALLGYGAAKLTDLNDEDSMEYRSRELIDEYKRNAMMADYSTKARRRQLQRQSRP